MDELSKLHSAIACSISNNNVLVTGQPQTTHNSNSDHRNNNVLAAHENCEMSDLIKAQIANHPLYPNLPSAYLQCRKVGAPQELASVLEEISKENHHLISSCYSTEIGTDPELDEFMESYCALLLKYKEELSKPFDEATTFLNNIESQLTNLCKDNSTTTSFKQRLGIMIDVACALEYLHHGFSFPVIHCDLKPSNVLLDEDMVAHLSDFGISKLLSEDQSGLYTKTLATLGYIAPEYGLEGLVSTKGDVYSYGIMLMETFTRRKPDDEMFDGDFNLKQWVSNSLLQNEIMEVVDVNLVTALEADDRHLKEKLDSVVLSIMELAIDCCVESPKGRINMKDVVRRLKAIKIY